MPLKNGDTAPKAVDPRSADSACPKCGAETEPIEIAVEGLPLDQLQLCPTCYLVTWRDQEGFHVRQGFPANGQAASLHEPDGLFYARQPRGSSC
jgi:hypothetical protein